MPPNETTQQPASTWLLTHNGLFAILWPTKRKFLSFYPSIVREICDKYLILLIIDEVIGGFGRTGKMFATEHFDVELDPMTMIKGITKNVLLHLVAETSFVSSGGVSELF